MKNEIGVGGRRCQRNARFQPRHHSQPVAARSIQLRLAIELRLCAERQPNINRVIERDAEKTRLGHTDDGEGVSIDRDALAYGGGVAREPPLPEAALDPRLLSSSGCEAGPALGGGPPDLPDPGFAAEREKTPPRDNLAYPPSPAPADIYLGLPIGETEDTGEDLIELPELLELRIGETFSASQRIEPAEQRQLLRPLDR